MMGRLSSFISSALIYSEMSHGRATANALGSHRPPTSKCLYNIQHGQHASYWFGAGLQDTKDGLSEMETELFSQSKHVNNTVRKLSINPHFVNLP